MANYPDAAPLQRSAARPVSTPHLGGRSTLVVEGRRPLLNVIAAALERAGCTPIEASSGEEAWQIALDHPIELVVAGRSLTRTTGPELVQRLRASRVWQRRDVPVIGLAEDARGEAELRSAGADRIIRAPFREAAILRAIRQVADAYWLPVK